eukprot:2424056-Prymnesium_polylepis.1
MVAPAGAPTPFPVPPRSPSTCGDHADTLPVARYAHRVNVPPALPGGPTSTAPNLFGVTTEYRDE